MCAYALVPLIPLALPARKLAPHDTCLSRTRLSAKRSAISAICILKTRLCVHMHLHRLMHCSPRNLQVPVQLSPPTLTQMLHAMPAEALPVPSTTLCWLRLAALWHGRQLGGCGCEGLVCGVRVVRLSAALWHGRQLGGCGCGCEGLVCVCVCVCGACVVRVVRSSAACGMAGS